MLGTIIGDVAGSTYEVEEIISKKNNTKVNYENRIKIPNKKVPLFKEDSSMTDDSILTIAIYDALINKKSYYSTLKEYRLKEINLGKD